MLRQREPRIHDAAHLAFVRLHPCSVCGSSRMIEAAHVRYGCLAIGKDPTGMQEKPSDCWTVPLCAYHHRTGIMAQHKMGEADFWQMHGRNSFEIAARLWVASGAADRQAEREANPKPAREKRVTPRKPRDQRAKMQSQSSWPTGQRIPSRPFSRPNC